MMEGAPQIKYEKPCVFCGGELGEEDDWNAQMRMHKDIHACVVELRARLDKVERKFKDK